MSEAGGSGENRRDRAPSPEDAALSQRLRDLDRRLEERRPEREHGTAPLTPARQGMAMALRLGADFVAGVLVGAVFGWGFDALLGTSPWGLIVFLLLGFAAGILSLLRTAGLIAKRPGLDDDAAFRRFD